MSKENERERRRNKTTMIIRHTYKNAMNLYSKKKKKGNNNVSERYLYRRKDNESEKNKKEK